MNLTKWNPFKEFEDFFNYYHRPVPKNDRLPADSKETITTTDWAPSVDISETDDAYLINAEIPGVKKEDVKVNVADGILSIQGHRQHEEETKDHKLHRIERSYGTFFRSFSLPEDVDEEKIHAEYKDGVLQMSLRKTEDKKQKAIEVKVK
jgi:HSP20 family protein